MYSSSNIIGMIKSWGMRREIYGICDKYVQIFSRKVWERRRLLSRPRSKRKDIIKIDLRGIWWEDSKCIYLDQHGDCVGSCECGKEISWS
jgi:hypothetical protein